MTGVQTCALPISRNASEAADRFDAHHIFGHLVAELPLDPQSERRAVLDLEGGEIHLVGQDGLGMKSVDEVDRLVIAAGVVERLLERIGAEEGEVAGLGLQSRRGDESGQLDALPLPDAAPALDAVVPRDLCTWRHLLELGQ